MTPTAVLDAAVVVSLTAVLAVLAAIDVRRRIVPNAIVLPAAAAVLAARTVAHPSPVWALAGLGAAAFFLLAAAIRPGGMGMGDVKLALLLGFALGPATPLALTVGLLAAAVPSVALLVRHGGRGRTMTIPYAPFLALGGVVALLVGADPPLGGHARRVAATVPRVQISTASSSYGVRSTWLSLESLSDMSQYPDAAVPLEGENGRSRGSRSE